MKKLKYYSSFQDAILFNGERISPYYLYSLTGAIILNSSIGKIMKDKANYNYYDIIVTYLLGIFSKQL